MADLQAADVDHPNPNIHDLFAYYNQIYFDGKLGPCTLQWSSKRMTLCAGLCQYSTYGGCEIRLSEPLLKYRPVSDLKNTLLHEMIHAYLFLTSGNKDHDDHGPCFQHMMMMINNFNHADEERPLDGYAITVYHNFTDEVDLYRTHHWRCVNCSDLIKRAMNRAPSASDCFSRSEACSHPRCHWHLHQKSCGGSFEKIREPAGYVDKRKKSATLDAADRDSRNGNDQSGDREDARLIVNELKRKLDSSGGTSKKGNKEPAVQVKSASLDNYFCPIQKDERKFLYTQTAAAVEKREFLETRSDGENLSPAEKNAKRKFLMLNDASQKKSRSRNLEEGKGINLKSQSFSMRKQVEESLRSKVASSQLEQSTIRAPKVAAASVDDDDDDDTTIISSFPKASRKTGAGKETSRTCGDSLSPRKKYKTVDELLKKQTSKEPLVILAWANWVAYESDEEKEEPLINRRTKRRKQEWNSDVSKTGKAIFGTTEELELLQISELPMETYSERTPEETARKVSNSEVANHNGNGKKTTPKKVIVTDDDHIFVELSRDEKFPEATTGKPTVRCSKGQSPNDHSFVPDQPFVDSRYAAKQDITEHSWTSATTLRRSSVIEGESLPSQRDRLNGREERNTTTDMMICPICHFPFRENERNTVVNKHIDECLRAQSA